MATFVRPQANSNGDGTYPTSASGYAVEPGGGVFAAVEPITLDGASAGRVTLGGTAPCTSACDVPPPVVNPPISMSPATKPQPPATSPAPAKCVVPKLTNVTLATAKLRLRTAHCALGSVRKVRSRKVSAGRVITQSRRLGTKLAAGTKVALTVSRGR